ELNFQFTKQLTDEGKTVYLIINQIDKHHDDELPFAEFRASAAEAFRRWGIEAARLFFLSLKDPSHPHNEWHELVACLRRLFADKEEWLVRGAESALKRIAARHLEHLRARHEPLEQEIEARLEALGGADDEAAAIAELDRLEEELADWQTASVRAEGAFRSELERVLQNAYVMPFETRERAEAYLQAMQPNFKVGLLFAKTKTEQDRKLLVQFGKEWNADDAWLSESQQWTAEWDETLLAGFVKQGVESSGAALLNYTDEVAAAIKKRYRDSALALFAELKEQIAKRAAAQTEILNGQLSAAREKVELAARLARLRAEQDERRRAFEQLIAAPCESAPLDENRLAALTEPPVFRKARHAEAAKPQAASKRAETSRLSAKEQALGQEAAGLGVSERADEARTLSSGGKQRSEEAAERLEEAAAW
ncbi:dynamin, partial [Anoxybacillus flavithermus]|nr:dynamin [Anoxybacillus flavithermus]